MDIDAEASCTLHNFAMKNRRRLLKLRHMSPEEIRWRVREVLQRRQDRKGYRRSQQRMPRTGEFEACASGLRRAAAELVPGTKPLQRRQLEREHTLTYRELRARYADRARQILSGSFLLLGHAVDLRGEINWHRDPKSGYRWPRRFYADIELYEVRDDVDVKRVWELGRQQYVAELARAWLFTHREDFGQRARAMMLAWIEHNPVYEGVHWASGLEVSMRAISWIWSLAALAEWEGWSVTDSAALGRSLFEHGQYLESHLSLYSSPYNHLIGEATGLYLLGCLFNGTGVADRWRSIARGVLQEHAERQFYCDGFSVEQALGYHFFTLGFLSMAIVAARSRDEPLAEVEAAAAKAYSAGTAFRRPDGLWPKIGDVDSARSLPVAPAEFWDFASLCRLAAAIFDDCELNLPSSHPPEELYWLCGCEGLQRLAELRPASGDGGTLVLHDSGYAVAGSGGEESGDWLLFDAGPIAEGLHGDATPSTAHGHADVLQVLYCAAGQPLLVDSGTPFYFGPRAWTDYSREAGAHCTLEVDGAPAAISAGRLAWSRAFRRAIIAANLTRGLWVARGRVRLRPGVTATRYLLALPGRGLWVCDSVEAAAPRAVRWCWQLARDVVGSRTLQDAAEFRLEGGCTLAAWAPPGLFQVRVERPTDGSPIAWQAPGYGRLEAGVRVHWESAAATRIDACTFVGSAIADCEVTVRGRRLACPANGHGFAPVHDVELADAPRAEIAWRIFFDTEFIGVAAGLEDWPDAREWRRLDGTGGWPTAYVRRAHAAVRVEEHVESSNNGH